MVARFEESSFDFNETDVIPDHDSIYDTDAAETDPAKYSLMGLDTFDHEEYPLATNIDDLPTAEMLYVARMKQLERTQPSAQSGGQGFGGVQDKVFIIHPRQ